jgi:hypothetical protein
MKGKTRILVRAVALAAYCGIAASASPVTSYLCIGELSTGFAMNAQSHKWNRVNFNPNRYVIKAPTQGPNAPSGALTSPMAVYEFGKTGVGEETAFCGGDFNAEGYLFCSGLGEDFNFNRQTLRFIHAFPHGYIEPSKSSFWGPEGSVTPLLEIGSCTAI